MESAFGIDHGEVSKSYNKLAPKLQQARKIIGPHNKTTMQDGSRIRSNYLIYRKLAGQMGQSFPAEHGGAAAQIQSRQAKAMLGAAGAQSKRKGRWLP